MKIINFGHPVTRPQKEELRRLLGRDSFKIVDILVEYDVNRPFLEQTEELFQKMGGGFSWDEVIAIIPPALNIIAILVYLKAREEAGRDIPIVRFKREGGVHARFVVEEVISL